MASVLKFSLLVGASIGIGIIDSLLAALMLTGMWGCNLEIHAHGARDYAIIFGIQIKF